jgi:hypothetical protein
MPVFGHVYLIDCAASIINVSALSTVATFKMLGCDSVILRPYPDGSLLALSAINKGVLYPLISFRSLVSFRKANYTEDL